MTNYVNRADLKTDLLGYATCMFNPTLMARVKVLDVVENIPGINVVHCENCMNADDCEIIHFLGADGYCSEGRAYEDE